MPKQNKDRISSAIKQRAKEIRVEQTLAETKIWKIIRNRQLGGYKFRRQHPIGRFIVDFFCEQAHLIIELDGDSHADQVEYDRDRTKWLQDRGYHVIRFTNRQVHQNLEGVAENVLEECRLLSGEKWVKYHPHSDAPSPQLPMVALPSPSGRGRRQAFFCVVGGWGREGYSS